MRIEEQHQDVLQNIEFAVATIYRRNPEMADYPVLRTYEALIRSYSAEVTGRPVTPANTDRLEEELWRDIRAVCEWRLGRSTISAAGDDVTPCEPIDVPTLVLCLKRLVKSVKKWNSHFGRQGYLAFITQFVR